MNNQGRRQSQIDFSERMVTIGYYGTLLSILVFLLYEYFS